MVWLRACPEFARANSAVTVVFKIGINLDKCWMVYKYLPKCPQKVRSISKFQPWLQQRKFHTGIASLTHFFILCLRLFTNQLQVYFVFYLLDRLYEINFSRVGRLVRVVRCKIFHQWWSEQCV